jgi:hypothetical protein
MVLKQFYIKTPNPLRFVQLSRDRDLSYQSKAQKSDGSCHHNIDSKISPIVSQMVQKHKDP